MNAASPSLPLSALELQESVRICRPLDTSRLNRVLGLDSRRALLEVQANARWHAIAGESDQAVVTEVAWARQPGARARLNFRRASFNPAVNLPCFFIAIGCVP